LVFEQYYKHISAEALHMYSALPNEPSSRLNLTWLGSTVVSWNGRKEVWSSYIRTTFIDPKSAMHLTIKTSQGAFPCNG